ncbi:hypothetical protein Thein_0704 [Thermodesulfatator indicus DSM 15286]|uniref:Uncharacterized protein n=1 Tax=Thermodesulfatator indicus (strain DSM 15286 / JCM 11887 / CIR29812) TaxID=667014 RepID=F8AC29_THEID|nr:hypothetical protein [Thermodesulfatator indicus]AEH44584.1 hypothetical protein Thein_0704 [Thermodesulfatator indicus DSM 15286]
MKTKNVSIPIDIIIEMLKKLNEEEKQEIFEKVFLEEDTSPLTIEEKQEIERSEQELKNKETISWPFGT